jgi:transposase
VEVAIGVDPSKSSLAVAAVDPLGRVVGTAEFSNDPRGHRALLRWARERGPDRVIGIESRSALERRCRGFCFSPERTSERYRPR